MVQLRFWGKEHLKGLSSWTELFISINIVSGLTYQILNQRKARHSILWWAFHGGSQKLVSDSEQTIDPTSPLESIWTDRPSLKLYKNGIFLSINAVLALILKWPLTNHHRQLASISVVPCLFVMLSFEKLEVIAF